MFSTLDGWPFFEAQERALLSPGCKAFILAYGPIASVTNNVKRTSHPHSTAPLPSLRACSAETRGNVGRNHLLIGREEYSTGGAFCEPPAPPALSNRARNCEKGAASSEAASSEVASSEESHADDGARSSNSIGYPIHDIIACPVAMRESDHQPIAGRKGGKQQLDEFYFNLGRSMMLDSMG